MLTEISVRKAIETATEPSTMATVSMDADLAKSGLDSLDFYNVLVELEKTTGLTVPDEDIDQLKSIALIIKYFNARA